MLNKNGVHFRLSKIMNRTDISSKSNTDTSRNNPVNRPEKDTHIPAAYNGERTSKLLRTITTNIKNIAKYREFFKTHSGLSRRHRNGLESP